MRSKLRDILKEFKADIVGSLSEGAVHGLLRELERYFVEEDCQKIRCDSARSGHSWAADTLIDCLKYADEDAFTKFLQYLSKNSSTKELYNRISDRCIKQDLGFILAGGSAKVRSQKESTIALLNEIQPDIANNLTQQDLKHMLKHFEEELKKTDIQRIMYDLENNGKDRAISFMINRLLQAGKEPVKKLIKYLSENKNNFFKDIRVKFYEYDLKELLPAAEIDELVMSKPVEETSKFPAGHEPENRREALPIPETVGGKSVENNDNTPKYNAMERYKMSSQPRGVCLIINNEDFSQTRKEGEKGYTDREGSNVDEENLCNLFSWLSFTVRKKRNIEALEMWNNLKDLSQEDHSKYDCLVVCILSHGLKLKNKDQIVGIDGKPIGVESILSLFRENNSLSGKPKLFFLQCCRGKVEDKGVVSKGTTQHDGPAIQYNDSETLPVTSDFFVGYSTPPGFKSWRNTTEGSWYIATLCKVISEYAKVYDLMTMAAKINNMVSEYSTDENQYQIPNPTMTLRKLLFFNPN